MEERAEQGAAGREEEQQQQAEHFQSWEKFWGRPGYGAPRDTAHKENLMKMLHYPQNAVKNVSAAKGYSFNISSVPGPEQRGAADARETASQIIPKSTSRVSHHLDNSYSYLTTAV